MDDAALRAELDRLVPEPRDVLGWDDVLSRAGRIHRRRRGRTALVALAVLLLTLAAALGAAGQLDGLLSRSAAPHLLVRGDLRGADGARAGTIEIELARAAIAFDRHKQVHLWGTPSPSSFPVRWFLERGGSGGALYLRRPGSRRMRVAVLCRDCRTRDSGRLDLSYAQASALVDGRLLVVLAGGTTRLATGRLFLDRAHLRRGLACRRPTPPRCCSRIYTGR
jgi:hypothetical protein